MLKAEFRFLLVNFVPILNFLLGVGHVAVTTKKLRKLLALAARAELLVDQNLFSKKAATGSPALHHIPATERATMPKTSRRCTSMCQWLVTVFFVPSLHS